MEEEEEEEEEEAEEEGEEGVNKRAAALIPLKRGKMLNGR